MSELSAEQTRLAQLWEEHMRHEFQTCSTEDTLATMIEDAYVNHMPVITGGVGHAELRQFYATHFIPKMPPDMEMTPLSRTIGTDQLVDEMVACASPIRSRWTGCCRGSRPPESGSRSRFQSHRSARATPLRRVQTRAKGILDGASQLCAIGYLAKISCARLSALSAAASGAIPLLTMSFQAT